MPHKSQSDLLKLSVQDQLAVLRTLKQGPAAAVVGLSPVTFRNRSDIPRDAGRYDLLGAFGRWYREYVGSRYADPDELLLEGAPGAAKVKLIEARTRKLEADASRAEDELAVRRGRFQDIEDLREEWTRAGSLLRKRLEAVGKRHPEARPMIERAILDTWRELGIEVDE